jgi:hypothetical protein
MMPTGLSRVFGNLDSWENRMRAASLALGQNWAGKLEGEMKTKAPWTDRTGNARAGLFATATLEREDVVIRLAHTVDYGKYLELANDGRYAILEPTRRAYQRQIHRDYRELWGR